MKKWLWIPILVILFFLYCCQKQEKVDQSDMASGSEGEKTAAIALTIGNNLDLAEENLVKGQVSEGAGLLLDSVLLAKPREQWPKGFVANVSSAKEQFAAGNVSGAVENVTMALDLVGLPEEIGLSTENGEVAPLAAVMKGKIEEAREEFKKGNVDRGVISILQALQLFAPKTK